MIGNSLPNRNPVVLMELPKRIPGLAMKRGALATDYSNRCPNKNVIGPRRTARSVSAGIPIKRVNNHKTLPRFLTFWSIVVRDLF